MVDTGAWVGAGQVKLDVWTHGRIINKGPVFRPIPIPYNTASYGTISTSPGVLKCIHTAGGTYSPRNLPGAIPATLFGRRRWRPRSRSWPALPQQDLPSPRVTSSRHILTYHTIIYNNGVLVSEQQPPTLTPLMRPLCVKTYIYTKRIRNIIVHVFAQTLAASQTNVRDGRMRGGGAISIHKRAQSVHIVCFRRDYNTRRGYFT